MVASTPLPQPQPASVDDKLAAFDSVPLFMKSLPEDAADDPIVGALQSLAFEGTPDGKYQSYVCVTNPQLLHLEIAQNFKEQGNDYFKGRRYREALGFYTQGVDAKPTDEVLMEALLCNRAACNLALSEINPACSPSPY